LQVIEHMPAFVWWIIAIAGTAGWVLRSKWVKGLRGELSLRFFAWLGLDKTVYHRLHNVMLRTPDGATQIDHVFISRFGVFVVETKHMAGWIFGKEADPRWTQSLYGKNRQFQNPLRQNYKHVRAVEDALGTGQGVVHSVVVFTGNSKFQKAMPPNVTVLGGFVSYVKSFYLEILPQELVDRFVVELQRRALPKSNILRRHHVRRLRQRSDPNAYRRCPKCCRRLVIRTVRRGSSAGNRFWGCSTYPKCKYTQAVS
jgi:restriction system protein